MDLLILFLQQSNVMDHGDMLLGPLFRSQQTTTKGLLFRQQLVDLPFGGGCKTTFVLHCFNFGILSTHYCCRPSSPAPPAIALASSVNGLLYLTETSASIVNHSDEALLVSIVTHLTKALVSSVTELA